MTGGCLPLPLRGTGLLACSQSKPVGLRSQGQPMPGVITNPPGKLLLSAVLQNGILAVTPRSVGDLLMPVPVPIDAETTRSHQGGSQLGFPTLCATVVSVPFLGRQSFCSNSGGTQIHLEISSHPPQKHFLVSIDGESPLRFPQLGLYQGFSGSSAPGATRPRRAICPIPPQSFRVAKASHISLDQRYLARNRLSRLPQ